MSGKVGKGEEDLTKMASENWPFFGVDSLLNFIFTYNNLSK